MTALEILNKYIEFFKKQNHVQIANFSLVPENDPTTLFTSSGMQPLVSYLLGEAHPQGKRLVNAQNCFRAQDIDEIGDNRHTTFFRMLGNWSLGDYFKKEQIPWFFEFLTEELSLDPNKLYVTVFEGFEEIEKDTESEKIWKSLFEKKGINPEGRISYYGVDKNWWSRSGTPDKMPVGEPGGPDTEVFYDFGTEHDPKFGDKCHVNCDCGRYMEIGNSVFMQYIKTEKGFQDLPKQNVDFGGGLERLVAATENKQDIFETSLFTPIINAIEKLSDKKYSTHKREIRIIVDHIIASVFISAAGIYPSNKEQGYVLRRLIRRAIMRWRKLNSKTNLCSLIDYVIEAYRDTDPLLIENKSIILEQIEAEENKFRGILNSGVERAMEELEDLQRAVRFIIANPHDNNISLVMSKDGVINTYLDQGQADLLHQLINLASNAGVKAYYVNEEPKTKFNMSEDGTKRKNEILEFFHLNKIKLNSNWAFRFVTTFGVPLEILQEIAREKDLEINTTDLDELKKRHQEQSRVGAAQKFAGGLADHSEKTIMGHTATHLLHKALRDMFGEGLHQSGSNITSERLRFDYNFDRKLTPEEIKKLEDTINEKIQQNLPVHFEMMPLEKAKEIGAIGLFDDKYADNVKVYFVGDYSKEFCGGPHVDFTGQIKRFKIIKEEALGRSLRRIYAVVGD